MAHSRTIVTGGKARIPVAGTRWVPAKIDVPEKARAGEKVTLSVTDWVALEGPEPDSPEVPDADASTMPASVKKQVIWRIDGKDEKVKGEKHVFAPSADQRGKKLQVEAYVGTPSGRATGELEVPAGCGITRLSLRGTDKRDIDRTFAPGGEDVRIHYFIDDVRGASGDVTIELFGSTDGKLDDTKAIWTRKLTADEHKDGDHDLPWSGKIDGADKDAFPDGYVTWEHSPYKLRITMKEAAPLPSPCSPEGGGVAGGMNGTPAPDNGPAPETPDPAVQECAFAVELAGLEVGLGPRELIADAMNAKDQRVYDGIKTDGGVPKVGETRQVRLRSNIFALASSEWYAPADPLHDTYERLWGLGPMIPLVAEVWFRGRDGKNARAPLAIGHARVLWDFEDPTNILPNVLRQHPGTSPSGASAADCLNQGNLADTTTKTFLNAALNYKVDAGLPKDGKGRNVHVDRGGKRVTDGSDVRGWIFEAVDPAIAERPKQRTWAVYTKLAQSGPVAGRAGVFFRPSRIAGDNYILSVYLETTAGKLDVTDKAPLTVDDDKKQKATTGVFEVWREIDMATYQTKGGTFVEPVWDQFTDYFKAANMKINLATKSLIDSTKYKAAVTKVTADLAATAGNEAVQYAVDDSADQWTASQAAVVFRTYDAFKDKVKAVYEAKSGTAQGWIEAQAWMVSQGVHTEEKYLTKCNTSDQWGQQLATAIVSELMDNTVEGLHVFQFGGVSSLDGVNGISATFGGYAAFPKSATRTACAVIINGDPAVEHTTAFGHEFGHHNFMPHAAGGSSAAGGPDAPSHDVADTTCLMAYGWGPEYRFCGNCNGRLRGWPRLDPTGANNSAS